MVVAVLVVAVLVVDGTGAGSAKAPLFCVVKVPRDARLQRVFQRVMS